MEKEQFNQIDFVVFIGMFIIASAIGLYHAYRDRKKNNTENYYFGGNELSPIMMGLSIAVSFISAITIIGYPTEVYFNGMIILWYPFAACFSKIIACLYYIPLIHRLKLVSIYQFLELRFNHLVRKISSFLGILNLFFYLSTTMYLPALALSAVTPLELNTSILITGVVCTFYTTLGGMKAVVWTDAFQALIMFGGQIVVLIASVSYAGGWNEIWISLERGKRNNLFDFTPDLTQVYTGWSAFVSLSITYSITACINQPVSQRYLSCKSIKDARIACVFATIPTIVIMVISVLTGAAMYAYYEGCDPLQLNKVEKPDQLLPYMVMDIFENVPGVAGLFVSAAFSGTLSTVSSGINSLSVLVMEDLVVVFHKDLNENRKYQLSKLIVLVFGVSVSLFAFSIQFIGSTIIEISFVIFGCISGPVLGVFTLGLFFPWANSYGTLIAQGISTGFCFLLGLMNLLFQIPHTSSSVLPLSISNCSSFANSTSTFEIITDDNFGDSLEGSIFAVSFLYYGPIGCFLVVIIGLLLSFLTGFNKSAETNPELFVPIFDNECLPESVRHFFRFGVPLPNKKSEENNLEDETTKLFKNTEV